MPLRTVRLTHINLTGQEVRGVAAANAQGKSEQGGSREAAKGLYRPRGRHQARVIIDLSVAYHILLLIAWALSIHDYEMF